MELEILKKQDILSNVKVENEMFSLTDLYDLAGKPKSKNPNDWIRTDSAKELVDTVASILNTVSNRILKTKRGKGGGTYAHKSIALAYAKYLDAKLHVLVNEVFFERVEEEKNPDLAIERGMRGYEKKGMTPQWITKRLHAKGIRNEFTSTLKKHGVMGDGYQRCTNAMYIELYGKDASGIRESKNLKKDANIRETMSSLELSAIALAESLAMEDIEINRRYGNEECALTSNNAARQISQSIIQFRKNNKKTISNHGN